MGSRVRVSPSAPEINMTDFTQTIIVPSQKSKTFVSIVTVFSLLTYVYFIHTAIGFPNFFRDVFLLIQTLYTDDKSLVIDMLTSMLFFLSFIPLSLVPLFVYKVESPSKRKVLTYIVCLSVFILVVANLWYAAICTGKFCDLGAQIFAGLTALLIPLYAYLYQMAKKIKQERYTLAYIWMALLVIMNILIFWAN